LESRQRGLVTLQYLWEERELSEASSAHHNRCNSQTIRRLGAGAFFDQTSLLHDLGLGGPNLKEGQPNQCSGDVLNTLSSVA
jgi:hypothetical protein